MVNGDQNCNGCSYSLRSCLNFHVISPVKTNVTITTMKTIGLKQSVAENYIKLEHVSSNVFFIPKVFQKKRSTWRNPPPPCENRFKSTFPTMVFSELISADFPDYWWLFLYSRPRENKQLWISKSPTKYM